MNHDSTAASNAPPPPLAHAIGGSLGSALALILFYPLERARIEMQQAAATVQQQSRPVLPSRVEMPPSLMGGSPSGDTLFDARTSTDADITTTEQISPAESWVETERRNSINHEDGDMMGGTPQMRDDVSQGVVPTETIPRSKGLLECLIQLRQRGELYQGVTPVVLTMAISNYVFFYMHALIKKLMMPSLATTQQAKNSKKNSIAMSLIASSLAGVVNVLMTNPLWVANLRIVTGKVNSGSTSLFDVVREIWQQEGLAQLWNGSGTSLLLVSNPVIQFFCYEQLKASRLLMISSAGDTTSSLAPLDAFVLGAVAKAISTVVTYPLQLTQTLLRVQKSNQQHQQHQQQTSSDGELHQELNSDRSIQIYSGTMDCLVKLYEEKGIEGLFAGMRPKMLQTVLTAAFTFLTYEQILRVVHTAHLALKAPK